MAWFTPVPGSELRGSSKGPLALEDSLCATLWVGSLDFFTKQLVLRKQKPQTFQGLGKEVASTTSYWFKQVFVPLIQWRRE